jgi:hypothetical protein
MITPSSQHYIRKAWMSEWLWEQDRKGLAKCIRILSVLCERPRSTCSGPGAGWRRKTSEEKRPESFYRDVEGYEVDPQGGEGPYEVEGRGDQVFAVRPFLTLSELAIALVEALSEKPEQDRNPLSRRYRDIGGVGVE